MAGLPSNLAVFKVDNQAGTLTDISANLRSVSSPVERDMGDSATFGDSDKESVPLLKGRTFSIAGLWDATLDAVLALDPASAASRSFEYGPESSVSGKVKYTGECHLTSYEISGEVAGQIEFSAEFVVTGAVTRGTYA